MDISYTNVLKGARQYFQGLPAAGGGGELPPRKIANRASAPGENDGSVRSEQHSAVPVYWDQQNEGQAAANLTNRDAPPLAMSQHQHQHQQQAGGGTGGGPPSGYHVRASVKNESGPSGLYHSHISSVANTNKTYYELQTQRAPSAAAAPPPAQPKSADAGRYSSTSSSSTSTAYSTNPSAVQHTYYPPSSSSSNNTGGASSQDPQYYKTYTTSQHYYYPQQQPQHPQHPPQRRHLPVQPSNIYHHTSRNVVANVAAAAAAATKLQTPTQPQPPPQATKYNVGKPSNATNYNNAYANSYYANTNVNANYPISNTNTYGTTSSTVSRPTYVNTPHPPSVTNYPPRPIKTQTQSLSNEYAPSPSPASIVPVNVSAPVPAPAPRMPVPKVRRESPLDLSVKTVRTSADSTLGDGDNERHYRPAARFDRPQYFARAPKVDFLPNFEMQQEVPVPPQPKPQQQHLGRNNYYNYPYATSSLPKVDFDFQQRKRSLEHAAPPVVPEKMPKVDTWRQKMDLQIEQRLNSYAKPQQQQQQPQPDVAAKTATTLLPNGGIPSLPHAPAPYPHHQHQHQQQPLQQQYSYYNNMAGNKQPLQNKEATSTKPPATKKVLNLLRTSLQNKGIKTVARKVLPEPPARSYMEREVLQPSTDVMAPLQPKPGIVGRRNVSPFTAASLERNSNTPPTYKFHIPKAIDSVIISDEGEKEQEASMGSDLDGLAAFLAARIRTKAELKQVSSQDVRGEGGAAPGNNNGSSAVVTPPQLKKEPGNAVSPPCPIVIPKKLFGRSEMKRAEVRSSSETSVFDFPDSDNEAEMPVLDRQGLLNMRKDRRLTPNSNKAGGDVETCTTTTSSTITADDDNERPSSPFSLLFNQTCDSFVEQLMGGAGKKRGRRKKEFASEGDAAETGDTTSVEMEIKKEVIESEVVVKQEPPDEDETKNSKPEVETEAKAETETKTLIAPAPPQEAEFDHGKHTDTDSDTPLVHIATKQRKKFSKKEPKTKLEKKQKKGKTRADADKEVASSDSEVEKFSKDFYEALKAPIAICKPGKKPAFGDGSDFRPGWEDALYRYKKSIRIPMQLIQVTRPPSSQRLSTSLPDLDPCPISPAPKTPSLDSDMDSSNCSFSFSKHYDSDQGSMKSYSSKCSILDKLLVRVGAKKRKRCRKDDVLGPKIIPKSENELLPTPSLEIKNMIVKSTSALFGFRKKTMESFKDAFMNNSNKIVGVNNEFSAVVLKARTRTETRVLKDKATIREVFGEDRPASAPPVTCVDELKPDEPSKGGKENQLKKEFNDVLIKAIESKKLEINVESIKKEKEDDNITVISNDSVETGSGRRRNKFRRKLSSGFDYIRKKKKQIKKDEGGDEAQVKSKRRGMLSKATPESIDDIQKEVKQWVLNKGVGETHLHRASRCGYTDITAYCLEKMLCNPSPKDNAGYTPLHEACSRGHLDIARLLLQYGAQVSESAHGGIRPLHEAAENGYIEIIRLLLSYGADPSLATYSGTTPLQLANDDATIAVLQQHLDELQGKSHTPWRINGPASFFDGDNEGFNPFADVPESEPQCVVEDIEFEVSEHLLPNLYILPDGEPSDRWVILQDLSNVLKIKSKETLLRQLSIASPSKSELVREMKMAEFLEKAHCCQFMNANEKLNTRLSKMLLVKYTDKVRRLLNVENIKFSAAGGSR